MRVLLARTLLAAGLFSGQHLPAADAPLPREVENEQIFGINKEPPHATLMPYASMEEVKAGNRRASSFARSLNGDWSFHWVPRPEERPVDFYQPDYDVSGWKTIPVPSCWQLHGYGTPYYRNAGYIFQKDWPRVQSDPPKNYTAYEERNPVGSYRRDFEVPAEWQGRRVFITFDGVDSNLYLWINGRKVGYSVNSRAPAEFDITPYLRPGKNVLAAEVYRFCAGSYLEDQDMWRLSGIFRNVTLWSAPTVHIRDFSVQPDLDVVNLFGTTVSITAKVRNYGASPAPGGRKINYKLYDQKGERIIVVNADVTVPDLAPGEEKALAWKVNVENPHLWTAETPYLYTSLLRMDAADGNEAQTELISCRTGFRKVEIKDNVFTINGVPVKLLGFNRHENEPETGHTVTEAEMIRDIELLKGCNSNHVRTCHYQDDPRWYELCDEYGLYLVAEANLESHGMGYAPAVSLSYQTRWEKAHVQRQIDNVETLKNHASAVIWSLGNEAGGGPNFDAAFAAVKKLDPTRPVHYQGFIHGGDVTRGDMISNMYTAPTEVEQAIKAGKYDHKPFYLCEFAHAMNNSLGGLQEYLDVINSNPCVIGGAIWEWQDQAIWNRRDPDHPFLAYGGGFGEVPNDGVFILKGGGVFADRSINPKYPEVKHGYQWIKTRLVDGKLEVRNRYAFTNLNKFKMVCTLARDGRNFWGMEQPVIDVAPGAAITVDVPTPDNAKDDGQGELFLRVAYWLREDERWAKAGTEVAWDQFKLPSRGPTPGTVQTAAAPRGEARLIDDGRTITVSGTAFEAVFDKATGALAGLRYGGTNIIKPDTGGLVLHAYRAPHLNDDLWAAKDWRAVGLAQLKHTATRVAARRLDSGAVEIEADAKAEGEGGFGFDETIRYAVSGDGSIAVKTSVVPHGQHIVLPRIGARVMLDPALDRFAYFGRGPMENYPDRKLGSDVGLYRSTVREQLTPYVRPMECGNHEDTRWCEVTGANGEGVRLTSGGDGAEGELMAVSALPYTDEQLEKAPYAKDLTPSTATVLCLSAKTLGVGSASCGPRPFPAYVIQADPLTYSYTLRPAK